jgi:heme oxygenase (biliverdin-IX-beta and delta-forming)
VDVALNESIARLLHSRKTAALGTLHAGSPFVSMVPYALVAEGFVVHVSELAAHTKDMLADACVSLLVTAAEDESASPLGLMRVTVQGAAERVSSTSPSHAELKSAYLARFPDAEQMFSFTDFSLFLIRPDSARFVAGFGKAHSLTGESLAQLVQQGH